MEPEPDRLCLYRSRHVARRVLPCARRGDNAGGGAGDGEGGGGVVELAGGAASAAAARDEAARAAATRVAGGDGLCVVFYVHGVAAGGF